MCFLFLLMSKKQIITVDGDISYYSSAPSFAQLYSEGVGSCSVIAFRDDNILEGHMFHHHNFVLSRNAPGIVLPILLRCIRETMMNAPKQIYVRGASLQNDSLCDPDIRDQRRIVLKSLDDVFPESKKDVLWMPDNHVGVFTFFPYDNRLKEEYQRM